MFLCRNKENIFESLHEKKMLSGHILIDSTTSAWLLFTAGILWATSSEKSACEHVQNVWIQIIPHMCSLIPAFALQWNIL